jgi:hypothetical protein
VNSPANNPLSSTPLYCLVALMLLIAKEDIDGLRVRDRVETVEARESVSAL